MAATSDIHHTLGLTERERDVRHGDRDGRHGGERDASGLELGLLHEPACLPQVKEHSMGGPQVDVSS